MCADTDDNVMLHLQSNEQCETDDSAKKEVIINLQCNALAEKVRMAMWPGCPCLACLQRRSKLFVHLEASAGEHSRLSFVCVKASAEGHSKL